MWQIVDYMTHDNMQLILCNMCYLKQNKAFDSIVHVWNNTYISLFNILYHLTVKWLLCKKFKFRKTNLKFWISLKKQNKTWWTMSLSHCLLGCRQNLQYWIQIDMQNLNRSNFSILKALFEVFWVFLVFLSGPMEYWGHPNPNGVLVSKGQMIPASSHWSFKVPCASPSHVKST